MRATTAVAWGQRQMDVAGWLHDVGLGQYTAAFIENSVSMDLLPTLTADDLKDLGISAVGHRRRLLNAIATLDSGATAAEGRKANELKPTAERGQLSIVFCDISGSTALSTRLDPEDLVVRGYQACVRSTIGCFGGFIARYVGDGVLIYFGWPSAHETGAESAFRAGLAVIAAIRAAPIHGEHLSIRIGIATGLVVVGEPIGEGDARQQTAIGELRACKNLAGPNGIVIDSVTRRQVGGLFECRDLGAFALKGLPDPVQIWQVMAETAIESRFQAPRANAITPLVGRGEELDFLLRCWAHAKSGEGRVVLLSGEAGIGKSRLIAELEQCMASG